MKRLQLFSFLSAVVLLSALPCGATPITFTGTSGTLEAAAEFSVSGNYLMITLTNTSAFDVADPAQILTALFFDIEGQTLTPFSAFLSSGSMVWFDSDLPGSFAGNVGGEWAYASGISGSLGDSGISSSGFGIFGNANFGGDNLDDPLAVDGLNYGITSTGDDTSVGNAAVTGGFPLIQDSVIFLLSLSTPIEFDPERDISNVSFQYGTALTEPNVPGEPGPGPGPLPVPEPMSLILLGSGLAGLGLAALRKKIR